MQTIIAILLGCAGVLAASAAAGLLIGRALRRADEVDHPWDG